MSIRYVKKEIRAGVGADGALTGWHFIADRFWTEEDGNETLLPPTTIPLTDEDVSALMGHAYAEVQKVAAAHAETVVAERADKEAAEKEQQRLTLENAELRRQKTELQSQLKSLAPNAEA